MLSFTALRQAGKSVQVLSRAFPGLKAVKKARQASLNGGYRRLLVTNAPPASDGSGNGSGPQLTGFQGFLSRLLSPSKETGKNPILRVLGYYTAESQAIGTGHTLYDQILQRSNAAIESELGEADGFMPRFELLTVHVYITLRRLRIEKGTAVEKDCELAMQILFERFWKDVRFRMMMEEGGLTLLQSGRWLKECERIFFGTAAAYDEAWGDDSNMNSVISKSVSCMQDDKDRINKFRLYILNEYARLERASTSQIWEGYGWDSSYRARHTR